MTDEWKEEQTVKLPEKIKSLSDYHHPSVEGLWAYNAERWRIQQRKEAGEAPPWTEDHLLQMYHFCCVKRADDRGSRWYVEHVATPIISNLNDLLFQTVMYRLVNNVGWFETAFPDRSLPTLEDWRDHPDQIMAQSEIAGSPWSPAYRQLRGLPNVRSIDNLARALDWLAENMEEAEPLIFQASNLSKVRRELLRIPQVGPFIAMQIYCDLIMVKALPFSEDDDVVIGPGAMWGLRILAGNAELDDTFKEITVNRQPDGAESKLLHELWKDQPVADYGFLSLCDVQGSLCEYSKYMRLRSGTGRKRIYEHGLGSGHIIPSRPSRSRKPRTDAVRSPRMPEDHVQRAMRRFRENNISGSIENGVLRFWGTPEEGQKALMLALECDLIVSELRKVPGWDITFILPEVEVHDDRI